MKKLLLVLLAVLLFSVPAFAHPPITVFVDRVQVNFDQQPVIRDDRTLVPMRRIFEALDAEVFWDEPSQSIHLVRKAPYTSAASGAVGKYGDTVATTSTAKLYCDNQRRQVSAYTINDYTYYKLRDIADLIDMGITWNESTFTIGMDTTQSYK